MAFSPDGRTLASGDDNNTIRLWEAASGKEERILGTMKAHGVTSVAFSPDGKTLASGGGGNRIQLWDIGTRKERILLDMDSEYAAPRIVFSPDGRTLASGGRCIHEIRLWDTTTGKLLATIEGHDAYGIHDMIILEDGKTLVSVGHDSQIKHWEAATGKNTIALKTADWAPAAAFSPDGRTMAIARLVIEDVNGQNVAKDNRVILHETATGRVRASLEAENASFMAFSPDGRTLAIGSEAGLVTLWDATSGKERCALKKHTDKILFLSFSPDGTMLATASDDKTVLLWDLPKTN